MRKSFFIVIPAFAFMIVGFIFAFRKESSFSLPRNGPLNVQPSPNVIHDQTTYYAFETSETRTVLKYSPATNVPANLFVKFPSDLKMAYKHPLYLHLNLSEDSSTLAGILYSTDQRAADVHYKNAERLVFQRIN